jgi:hypothetical protein
MGRVQDIDAETGARLQGRIDRGGAIDADEHGGRLDRQLADRSGGHCKALALMMSRYHRDGLGQAAQCLTHLNGDVRGAHGFGCRLQLLLECGFLAPAAVIVNRLYLLHEDNGAKQSARRYLLHHHPFRSNAA